MASSVQIWELWIDEIKRTDRNNFVRAFHICSYTNPWLKDREVLIVIPSKSSSVRPHITTLISGRTTHFFPTEDGDEWHYIINRFYNKLRDFDLRISDFSNKINGTGWDDWVSYDVPSKICCRDGKITLVYPEKPHADPECIKIEK